MKISQKEIQENIEDDQVVKAIMQSVVDTLNKATKQNKELQAENKRLRKLLKWGVDEVDELCSAYGDSGHVQFLMHATEALEPE